MRRVNMRERPLALNKKLSIVRAPELLDAEAAAAIRAVEEAEGEKKPKKAEEVFIPTPMIKEAAEYTELLRRLERFELPAHYIKCLPNTGSGLVTQFDQYDLLQDDIDWMEQYNKDNVADRAPLTEDALEALIDLYEKEAFILSPDADPSETFTLQMALTKAAASGHRNPKACEAVYNYWRSKRITLGKALYRRFQQPPPVDDPSHHVAFRPRQAPRRISHRNPRKNDASAFDKMRFLLRDFRRLQKIAEGVVQRETMKRDQTRLSTDIFYAQLADSLFGRRVAALPLPPDGSALPEPADPERLSRFAPLLRSPLPQFALESLEARRSSAKARRQAGAAAAPPGRPKAPKKSAGPRPLGRGGAEAKAASEDESDAESSEGSDAEEFYAMVQRYVDGRVPVQANPLAADFYEDEASDWEGDAASLASLDSATLPPASVVAAPAAAAAAAPSPAHLAAFPTVALSVGAAEGGGGGVGAGPPGTASSSSSLLAPAAAATAAAAALPQAAASSKARPRKHVGRFRGRVGRGGRLLVDFFYYEPSFDADAEFDRMRAEALAAAK